MDDREREGHGWRSPEHVSMCRSSFQPSIPEGKKEYLVTHIPKKKTADVSQSTDRSKAGEEALGFPSGDSLSCLSPPGTECDSTCSQSQHLGGWLRKPAVLPPPSSLFWNSVSKKNPWEVEKEDSDMLGLWWIHCVKQVRVMWRVNLKNAKQTKKWLFFLGLAW